MTKKPIIHAYGIRWKQRDLALMPQFRHAQAIGVYVLYWKGLPVYVGRTKAGQKLAGRIGSKRKHFTHADWDEFSWFVVPSKGAIHDVEALCIRAFSDMRSKKTRSREPTNTKLLGLNLTQGGIVLERHMWRNYEVRGGKLSAYNEETRKLLKKSSRERCAVKHPGR